MSIDHGQPRTFLKVFVEVPDPHDEKSDGDNFSPSPNPSSSSSTRKGTSYLSPKQPTHSTQSQYCTITISPSSTAYDVCNAVARKRNLLYTDTDYELAMCDGDGQASYETILGPHDQPHQFQQSATKHGHLGDFHFVFRKANSDESDGDDDSDGDSEPDIFGRRQPKQIKYGKHPAAWMEKRGKNHKAWRRRYFVLIDNELLYYKRRDVYEHHKEPIARIELVNPPGIIKILPPETMRKNASVITLFLFDIHTPKRVYSLRVDNYNDMLFWVNALSRRNEPNELIDGMDGLIAESEMLHSHDDEAIMEEFSTLQSILDDKDATDAYMRYLQSIHNEEFIHFWLDLNQYLTGFMTLDAEKQKRFAKELYEKYIKSGAKYQLSEIRLKHRSNLKKQIESECISMNMFDDIKRSVYDFLNRDSYKFFISSEYFRFIVTYKPEEHRKKVDDDDGDDVYSWPAQFEKMIESRNTHKHHNIMHSHSKYYKNVHSPVLNMSNMNIRHNPYESPVRHINGGSAYKAQSWTTPNGALKKDNNNNNSHRKHTYKRSKKHTFSKSIFDNAPGIASSAK